MLYKIYDVVVKWMFVMSSYVRHAIITRLYMVWYMKKTKCGMNWRVVTGDIGSRGAEKDRRRSVCSGWLRFRPGAWEASRTRFTRVNSFPPESRCQGTQSLRHCKLDLLRPATKFTNYISNLNFYPFTSHYPRILILYTHSLCILLYIYII